MISLKVKLCIGLLRLIYPKVYYSPGIHNPGVEGSSPSFTTNKDAPFERLGRFHFGHCAHSVPKFYYNK